jgi:hypothetical protein
MTHPAFAVVGRYLSLFWRDCPTEALDILNRYVIPAARQDPSSDATDIIVHNLPGWGWYRAQRRATRQRFHCLVGHCIRSARQYDVVRDRSGRPLKRRSRIGPHATFTVQRRPKKRAARPIAAAGRPSSEGWQWDS